MVRTEANVIRPERSVQISTAIDIHLTTCLRDDGGGCFVMTGGFCSLACRFFFFDMARVSEDQQVDLALNLRFPVLCPRIEPGVMRKVDLPAKPTTCESIAHILSKFLQCEIERG